MTALLLLLLALAAAAPLLAVPGRRLLPDPVVPVAAVCALLVGAAAVLAARSDGLAGPAYAVAAVLGVLAATTAGSIVVRAVFRLVRGELLPRGPRPTPADTDPRAATEGVTGADGEPETVLRGGAWIGYLERAAVSATLLAGWPEGIALALAVKGVGRYSELRASNAPEAFIIGTFASVLWAAALAGVVHLVR